VTGDDDEVERVRRLYRAYAEDPVKRRAWSATNPGNLAIRDELEQAVGRDAGAQLEAAGAVLDVGCGSGWWLARLADAPRVGATLYGVELLPERAAAARQRVPEATVLTGDARALPFPDAGFDVVTLFSVLSSLNDLAEVRRALGEARRVLGRGGALLIWEPRMPNPRNRATLTIPHAVLAEALAGTQLSDRSITVVPGLARRLGGLTPTLYQTLARVPALRTHRLVCAQAPR
jgi:ubiquinone/menaquinone biosynthesis C-methylase UbiE